MAIASPDRSAHEMPERPDVVGWSTRGPENLGIEWLNSSATRALQEPTSSRSRGK